MNKIVKFSKTLKVLMVEDNKDAREQIIKLLGNFFDTIVVAVDGVDGLEKFKSNSYDLVISDINMPNMNGIEMVTKIRELNKEIPIIFLSANNDSEHLLMAISLRADGYVLKPVNFEQLMQTLKSVINNIQLVIQNKQYKSQLESMNELLEDQVNEKILEVITLNKEIQDTQQEVVFTIGSIAERRSREMGNHVKRVSEYSKILAFHYGLSEEQSEMLRLASPMHDIGKVAIPDAILNKPARLTDEEFTIMKKHAELGFEMLKDSTRPLLRLAATIAHEHHEHYDGNGYPQGLSGNDIDINARITAVADVFDAIGSDRVYKEAWSDEDIFEHFKKTKGNHFDPDLVNIFFENIEEFLNVRESLKD